MAAECGALGFSVVSLVVDVLQQHGNRSGDFDFDARRAEEAAMRRYDACAWLRKVVGVVGAKDLPSEPSEEEFRLGLRSGIILCDVINKIQPGSVSKIIESPSVSALIPDGAALSAFQYFENVRNFLVAAQEMRIPIFEASDLEQGGKTSRIVNCILGLKSFSEWKQGGSIGVWKFGGSNLKQMGYTKQFVRKNSDPFTNSLSRNSSLNEKFCNNGHHGSLNRLIRTVLLDKKPDEVPNILESVLNTFVDEFQHRIGNQIHGNNRVVDHDYSRKTDEKMNNIVVKKDDCSKVNLKQQIIVDKQKTDINELKQTIIATKAGIQFMQQKFQQEVQNLGRHVHDLAHAASGYHRVLEENRKLYNQVQDLKGSIRVYCRVRPFSPGQSNSISTVDYIEEGSITINAFSRNAKTQKSFNFNKVFGPLTSQEEVFVDTQPLIRSVLDGFNVCIFAYGQTGSGKTYTMSGPKVITEQSQGVNYRALNDLFLLAEQRKDIFSYDISVQMIEIYNEQVRDLLVGDGFNKRLEIRNGSQTGLSVPDASLVHVKSSFDVIELMGSGHRNRAVGATALNDRSSRSHSCLSVHVHGKDLSSGTTLHGCMHLVDLAGSERVDKSEATGDRLKEAQHINKSLSALGDVISALAQKNSHVPYRNSKLTQLLQDSLGGQAKTLMFVHISPETDVVGETMSTLKFAERVATVELGAARVNKDSSDVKELKEQILHLKAALLAKKEEETETKQPKIYGSPIYDVNEQLAISPPWPHISNSSEQDEREISSGEWVDKVMVNNRKDHHANGIELNLEQRWGNQSGSVTDDAFQQKFLPNPYETFRTSSNHHPFGISSAADEFDAATTDSSEPDLLWQFNQSKIYTTNTNTLGSKIPKLIPKQPKGSELRRSKVAKESPSPARKLGRAVVVVGTETKRKTGIRK